MESREPPRLIPVPNCTVPFASGYDFFFQFTLVDINQIYFTDCFFFCSVIDNHDETTCTLLFSINFRYIHILFNFPEGRKAGRFFLF